MVRYSIQRGGSHDGPDNAEHAKNGCRVKRVAQSESSFAYRLADFRHSDSGHARCQWVAAPRAAAEPGGRRRLIVPQYGNTWKSDESE
jgi:hypothetical protein